MQRDKTTGGEAEGYILRRKNRGQSSSTRGDAGGRSRGKGEVGGRYRPKKGQPTPTKVKRNKKSKEN